MQTFAALLIIVISVMQIQEIKYSFDIRLMTIGKRFLRVVLSVEHAALQVLLVYQSADKR